MAVMQCYKSQEVVGHATHIQLVNRTVREIFYIRSHYSQGLKWVLNVEGISFRRSNDSSQFATIPPLFNSSIHVVRRSTNAPLSQPFILPPRRLLTSDILEKHLTRVLWHRALLILALLQGQGHDTRHVHVRTVDVSLKT